MVEYFVIIILAFIIILFIVGLLLSFNLFPDGIIPYGKTIANFGWIIIRALLIILIPIIVFNAQQHDFITLGFANAFMYSWILGIILLIIGAIVNVIKKVDRII